jgi:hypothetical protein
MTAAASATLDRFEARTHDVLAAVTRVRRALRDHGRLLLTEPYGYFLLRRLAPILNNQWLASLQPDEAHEAARHLGVEALALGGDLVDFKEEWRLRRIGHVVVDEHGTGQVNQANAMLQSEGGRA